MKQAVNAFISAGCKTRTTWKHLLGGAALLLAGLLGSAVQAQVTKSADIASYQGADRHQRLVEGAKKEGVVNVYASLNPEDMVVLNAGFEAKYGIKVRMWRSGSEKVVQRALTEANAGRHEVDVLDLNSPALEALYREGLLQPVHSPYHADLMEAALPKHRGWVGTRLSVFVQAYNTKAIKKEDLPRTYEDLLNPKWKGKLGIEADDVDWFAVAVTGLGEEKGLKLFRDIATRTGLSVRKGHTLLTNLVAAGEVPLALTVYNYTAQQLKQAGAPIDWFAISPAIAQANGVAVAKAAPHPYAALLYYDFMVSEDGQQILAKRSFVPTRKQIKTELGSRPITVIDPALMLDQSAKWTPLFEATVIKQSK